MDEHLHSNVDKIFTGGLRDYKHDLSGEVWDKIDAGLNKENKRINSRFHQHQIKNSIWAILFIATVIAATTFQFRKDQPVANVHSPANPLLLNSKIPETLRAHRSPLALQETAAVFKQPPFLNKKLLFSKQSHASDLMFPRHKQDIFTSHILPGSSDQEIQEINVAMKSFHSDVSIRESKKTARPGISEYATSPARTEGLIVRQDKKNIKNRFSITPYFSQEFAGYDLTDNNDAYGHNGKEIERKERKVFSASAGFYVNFNIKKRWMLQSGISYSWSRSNIDSSKSYAVADNNGHVQFKINTVSGYGYLKPGSPVSPAIGDSVCTAKAYSELHYLSVPLLLSYNIPMKSFSLLIGGGVSFNMLTGSSIETKTYGPGNPEKEYSVSMMGLKKINMGIVVKADLEYHISPQIGIDLIPTFKNSVSPINPESALTAYPYNIGIGFGITYRF